MIAKTIKDLYDKSVADEVLRIHGDAAMVGSWTEGLLTFKDGKLHQLITVQLYSPDRGVFKNIILVQIPELNAPALPHEGFMIQEG